MFIDLNPPLKSSIHILFFLVLCVILWLIILTILYLKAVRHYRKLTEGVSGVDLVKLLEAHIQKVNETGKHMSSLEETIQIMRRESRGCIQKAGVVRFNPYSDTGGDQSFVAALLDAYGNGVVISSLHGRSGTRVYGKVVQEGKEAGYPFSDEENLAIRKALE